MSKIEAIVNGHRIDKDAVWFKVSRTKRFDGQGNDGGAWVIRKRDGSTLGMNRPPGSWGGDYATKDEAIEYGRSKGWILVEGWRQAQEQRSHYLRLRRAEAERRDRAIAGTVEVRIARVSRYVRPEVAAALLETLSDVDEFGVVR